tara:strand:+ start:604 stop:717 length:114 start_codon:yes stop_codon:yes gene_type:complete
MTVSTSVSSSLGIMGSEPGHALFALVLVALAALAARV